MSTVFNVRGMKVPGLTLRNVLLAALALVLVVGLAFGGYYLYKKLTRNTVVAEFTQTLALYPGDKVQIMGVQVGKVDRIEPAGDKMRVYFDYESKYKLPANVTASVLNPSLVASRTIQLSPAYTGGPVFGEGKGPEFDGYPLISLDRTQVPVEYDELRDSLDRILTDLGPTDCKQEVGKPPPAADCVPQPKGPFGDVIESFSDGLAGKGDQINKTLKGLSDALTTLNEGRGDFYGVLKSLALFVNALHQNDKQFVALNDNLAQFTNSFTNTDREVATALREMNELFANTRQFFDTNSEVLSADLGNLEEATNALLQPAPFTGLEAGLHIFPNLAVNALNIAPPVPGGVTALPVIGNFANPMEFVCSSIQAGSRLGYQESAELCAQYLAPILDSIKFNYLPFGLNQVSTALTLPKQIAYSEARLQPPPGYKDTTVPGIFSRDTLFSHGNHEPGWVVAPGMQGVDVQPFTANMLTPDSLGALLGGPDIAPPVAPPAFGVNNGRLPGPPNAYGENSPLPPPWYPQPGPAPGPAPGVFAGDPLGAIAPPANAGPALPAEAGAP